MQLFKFGRKRPALSHSIRDYQKIVRNYLRAHPEDRTLALAQVIGSLTMENFISQGDGQAAVLRYHGLADGMNIYDLGCGCGRTAQALQRSGWTGHYTGADVVPELLDEITRRCPGYKTKLNYSLTIDAPDSSLDMIYHWSVFTHLFPAESYLYTVDAFRALKPGGKMLFSFLEMEDPLHDVVWDNKLERLQNGEGDAQLDTFLHRDWIRRFSRDAGFAEPSFTDGDDKTNHPPLWQSLAVLEKPAE